MITADLRQRCETIVRLEQQRKELAEQIKEHKAAAKDAGYDVPLITKTVSLMLKDTEKQKKALDQHSLFDSYLAAVGLLPDGRVISEEAKANHQARNAVYPGAPTGEELARYLGFAVSQSQPSVASQAVERSAGDGPSQQTPPAAPIEHLLTVPDSQPADQAAGVEPRIPPAADLSMDIPAFLRRTKRLEVA